MPEMEEFQLYILRSMAFASSLTVPKKSVPRKDMKSFLKEFYTPAEPCAFGLMPALLEDYSGFQPFVLHHAHFKFKQEWFALPASNGDCQATATHEMFLLRGWVYSL